MKALALKVWNVKKLDKENALKIAQKFNIPTFLAMMLDIYNIDDVESFIRPSFEKILNYNYTDMQKAVDRIKLAIENNEKICICGDYDADGITSVAILYSYLESIGADVIYHIPERNKDGYGLNKSIIDLLKSKNVNLIVTVDNGITALEEVKYASSLGIDTVITDHHKLPQKLPEAVAIVDPQRENDNIFKELAGVGVTFKLILALEGDDLDLEFLLENYADIILIGTIADIVPLKDENRLLAKIGLSYINKTEKLGIISILKNAGLLRNDLNSIDIAFGLVPRINAAGRLSATEKVVELLTTYDENKASEIAKELENENTERKNLELKILEEIETLLRKEPERLYEDILIIDGESWHPGVIGIVASKLVEKYGKPTIVITKNDSIARGSARSIEDFSIYDAINSCNNYLLKFGGHTMAAGFDLKTEDVTRFRKDIKAFTKGNNVPFYSLDVACKLNPEMLSLDLINQIDVLEPFGKDNPKPIFGLYNMKLESIKAVGNGKHLRLTFARDKKLITAMKFFTTEDEFPYVVGDFVDLAVELSKSTYQGMESLSIFIKDMKFSGFENKKLISSLRTYEMIHRGETDNINLKEYIPTREDFAKVYRFLKNLSFKENDQTLCLNIDVLNFRINDENVNFCKMLLILDIMDELNLVTIEKDYLRYKIKLNDVDKKVDLNSSEILKRLT